jgi:hypothetical protein
MDSFLRKINPFLLITLITMPVRKSDFIKMCKTISTLMRALLVFLALVQDVHLRRPAFLALAFPALGCKLVTIEHCDWKTFPAPGANARTVRIVDNLPDRSPIHATKRITMMLPSEIMLIAIATRNDHAIAAGDRTDRLTHINSLSELVTIPAVGAARDHSYHHPL